MHLGHGLHFTAHILEACAKVDKSAAALNKILPNIKGPASKKRMAILLYAAPIWARDALMSFCRKALGKAQRKMLLRVASAYRTVSTAARQMIAGVPPIHLSARMKTKNTANTSALGQTTITRGTTKVS